LPRLVEIYEQYEDMGVKVVSIDNGSRSPAAETFLDENEVRHLVLNDREGDVIDAYRVVAIPVTVMIDHEGRVVFRHLGFSPEMKERFQKEIETLIAWRDAA
jgi:peroxiredoxin